MNRFQIIPTLLVAPLMACQSQQANLNPYKLKSGRVIYPKTVGPLIAPNMPKEKGFVYSYQTQLKIDDLKSLELEAAEIWQEIKPDFEKVPGITLAIIQADEKPAGMFIQQNRTYRFVIEHKHDGSWEWVKDQPKATK